MSDTVRFLTDEGCQAFHDYLRRLKESPQTEPPFHLLFDDAQTVAAPFRATVERLPGNRPFSSRYEFGTYLVQALAGADRVAVSLEYRLWNWLALYYFDQLCPADANGRRHPLADLSVYWLDKKFVWQRYYRHLVRSPWLAVSMHPETSRAILTPHDRSAAPLAARGELFEQIASRQSLFRSPAVMKAVYQLYFNPSTGKPRPGAGGAGAGSPRRFGAVMNQLGLTYDLEWGDDGVITSILPAEFARWVRPAK